MTNQVSPLFMLRFSLKSAHLFNIAKICKVPLYNTDYGYLVHCALTGLFKDHAPHTFVIEKHSGENISILAYSSMPFDELMHFAQLAADPAFYNVVRWEQSSSKPMPTHFKCHTMLTFNVRVCPIIRNKGNEIDVFLAECKKQNEKSSGLPTESISRENSYKRWLENQFVALGGVELHSSNLESFQLNKMYRRTQKTQDVVDRKGESRLRPEASMSGSLEIVDSHLFSQLLRRGIGRHRSFGLGMLLVKPVV
jgi:CRISPR system Cascade subunit CasE